MENINASRPNQIRTRQPKRKKVRRYKNIVPLKEELSRYRFKQPTTYNHQSKQSAWGETIPQELLYYIFQKIVANDSSLPALIRLGGVCTLWNKVSLTPSLWRNLDLSIWIKDKHRTEQNLKWLIENRLAYCTDLNLANWKITNILSVLECLAVSSPNLKGLSLAGWKGLSCDHLKYIVDQFRELKRIDLSSVNTKAFINKKVTRLIPLSNLMEEMNIRLTHLILAHNRLARIPQIINSLAMYCPNLLKLDLSNVSTMGVVHGLLHIEKLQLGCTKLKVLRITNSRIRLSTATIQEQVDSPGFPDLEELSVASLAFESRFIDDEYIQRILKTSKNLKVLDVRCCDRLTHDSLIRLPADNLKRLFLSGSSLTRDFGSGLKLIISKWAHSLTVIDLAQSKEQSSLENCLRVLAEKGVESPLSHIDLCGSSVSLEAAKEVLARCPAISSINLSSCRGLPRGVKRLFEGDMEIKELKENVGVLVKMKHKP